MTHTFFSPSRRVFLLATGLLLVITAMLIKPSQAYFLLTPGASSQAEKAYSPKIANNAVTNLLNGSSVEKSFNANQRTQNQFSADPNAFAVIQQACSFTGGNDFCGDADYFYTAPSGTFTYQWSVTGNATISGSATGQIVQVAAGTSGTFTITLILTNTTSGTQSTCNLTVTLDPPTCSITGANNTCPNSTNNSYTGPSGTNYTYQWSISGNGTINGATNGQSVNVTAGAAGSYTVTLTVSNALNNCSVTCSKQVTVGLPTCSISGATAVCATSTNNTYTGPAGANLSYSWSVTGNGTIVGSTTGQSVNVTAGAAGSYTVNLTVTNTQTGCSSTCSQQVTVNANPTCSITGAAAVCATSTNNTYTGPAGANLSYSWSVTGNGTIVGSTTGQSINVTAAATGSYTVNLTVTNTQTGCSSTCNKVVTVNPPPACSITGPDRVCANLPGSVFSAPAGANLSYSWSISGNGTIAGSTTGQTVSVNSGALGSFTLTLVLTDTQTGCSSTCTKMVTVGECDNCGPKGPGNPFPSVSEVSDQKAGSVLIYNLYTSGATSGNTQNTRVNITNISPITSVAVHLFFVAEGCSVADSYLCLTPNQTSSFLASDLDPGTTGYIVAVASDCTTGCPINFNCLIGDEYVKLTSGHVANLGAESVASLVGTPVACNGSSVTATINFDGLSYNRIPRVLAIDSIGSRADGNDTLLVVNRIGGNLGIGAATLGSMFGIFYDDAENALSYTFAGSCQFRSSLNNSFPRITPRYETFVPAGRTGWTKFWIPGADDNKGILGASLNFNPNTGTNSGAYSQGHNLHALKLDTINSYIIPVFPPSCCR